MDFTLASLQQVREDCVALKKPGTWFLINVEPRISWPTVAHSFDFEGHQVWVIPVTEDACPGLAMVDPKLDKDEVYALLYRALSWICWSEDGGAMVAGYGGGSPLFPTYGNSGRTAIFRRDEFIFTKYPEVPSEQAKLALALLREGRGLNHPGYSFLSFFRVVECAMPRPKERIAWMADAVGRIDDHRANEALADFNGMTAEEIGKHLFVSGRGAMAHASNNPIANPDQPADYSRLRRELPVIEALAVMAIEELLGVPTSQTIYRNHHYELRGWKTIFGTELINRIKAGEEPREGELLDLPNISIRLRRTGQYDPLENLTPTGWGVREKNGFAEFRSQDELINVRIELDFENERLLMAEQSFGGAEPKKTGGFVSQVDDGTVGAARNMKHLARFFQDWNANGELEIWNTESGELLSICDAYIPVNVVFVPERAEAELAHWDKEIVRRTLQQG